MPTWTAQSMNSPMITWEPNKATATIPVTAIYDATFALGRGYLSLGEGNAGSHS